MDTPGLLSPVARNAQSKLDWAHATLLVPHEPIRRCMAGMLAVKVETAEDAARFGRWYNSVFYKVVHHHHHVEETIYFPWIAARVGSIPSKLSADHETLIDKMEQVRALANHARTDATKRKELPHAIQQLCAIMGPHLDEEEEVIPDLLRKHFTKEENDMQVERVVKAIGLKGNKTFLPMVLHAMEKAGGYGPELTVDIFVASLPPPIRLLNRVWFTPSFERDNKTVLNMLGSIPTAAAAS